jgi:hypothetical protein
MATVHNTAGAQPRLAALRDALHARRLWLTLLAIFALALAPRLYRLDAQSLWLDEGATWAEVTGRTGKVWAALLAELVSPDAGYPLYHLLLKAWVALAGDTEWALRLPSALAGAAAVVIVYLAAREVAGVSQALSPRALLPAMLAAASPFALWHAQDAKAYGLLLLASSLVTWALPRALRRGMRSDWLLVAALVLASLFVHRLALLGAAGVLLVVAIGRWTKGQGRRTTDGGPRVEDTALPPLVVGLRLSFFGRRSSASLLWLLLALACGAIGVAGTILAARGEAVGVERANIGPLSGIGLILARFSLDRWPGEVEGYLGLPAALWLLPFALLALWGLALLARDAAGGSSAAAAVLCLLLVPLGLYAVTLALAPVFQARYAAVAFPAWALALCYPLLRDQGAKTKEQSSETHAMSFRPLIRGLSPFAFGLWLFALLAGVLALVQPGRGLFSGDPVKEQWREAVAELAARTHPDDLTIVQPYYVLPLYDYYAPRVTPDPLPRPVTFPIFAEGDTGGASGATRAQLLEHVKRRYDPFFNQAARGAKRALLLIAPDHAATVDPPKTLAELTAEWERAGARPEERPTEADTYGWLGLRFQYPQRSWPCGGAEFLGVALMCQSFPETFNAGGGGEVPEPTAQLPAVFGGELRLRGYTIAPHGDALRPGGALPVTLFWEATAPPTRRYRMFLHLCRDCEMPPVAATDGPPLYGYPPAGDTTTWLAGDPVHDERTLALPRDLPPGRYTLLLGVYPEDQPTIEARLPVTANAPALPSGRLVLAELVVGER